VSITGTTVTHNQRWIELAGADNTRDLGGLATDDGGRTRFGIGWNEMDSAGC